MPKGYIPPHHKKEIWDLPDYVFHPCVGMPYGGKKASSLLNCSRETLYRKADEMGLTAIRRNRLHGGRYFLVSEIHGFIQKKNGQIG